jgi:hypothetical protein
MEKLTTLQDNVKPELGQEIKLYQNGATDENYQSSKSEDRPILAIITALIVFVTLGACGMALWWTEVMK